VTRETLIQGAKRLGPFTRNGSEIKTERNRTQELHCEQRYSSGIRGHPAHHTVDRNGVISWQHPLREVAKRRSVQQTKPQRLSLEVAADPGAEFVQLRAGRV
jgi:hypothetical protein